MFVIKLPNGNLMAPESAMDADGQVVGDAYVEVFPTDPEYARLAQQAVTEAGTRGPPAPVARWRRGAAAGVRDVPGQARGCSGQDSTGPG